MIASTAEARSVTIAAFDAADRARATPMRALCAVRPLRALAELRADFGRLTTPTLWTGLATRGQPGPITARAQQPERARDGHQPPAPALSEVAA